VQTAKNKTFLNEKKLREIGQVGSRPPTVHKNHKTASKESPLVMQSTKTCPKKITFYTQFRNYYKQHQILTKFDANNVTANTVLIFIKKIR